MTGAETALLRLGKGRSPDRSGSAKSNKNCVALGRGFCYNLTVYLCNPAGKEAFRTAYGHRAHQAVQEEKAMTDTSAFGRGQERSAVGSIMDRR